MLECWCSLKGCPSQSRKWVDRDIQEDVLICLPGREPLIGVDISDDCCGADKFIASKAFFSNKLSCCSRSSNTCIRMAWSCWSSRRAFSAVFFSRSSSTFVLWISAFRMATNNSDLVLSQSLRKITISCFICSTRNKAFLAFACIILTSWMTPCCASKCNGWINRSINRSGEYLPSFSLLFLVAPADCARFVVVRGRIGVLPSPSPLMTIGVAVPYFGVSLYRNAEGIISMYYL